MNRAPYRDRSAASWMNSSLQIPFVISAWSGEVKTALPKCGVVCCDRFAKRRQAMAVRGWEPAPGTQARVDPDAGYLKAFMDRPGGDEIEDEGEDSPTVSLRSWWLCSHTDGTSGSLSRCRTRGKTADRPLKTRRTDMSRSAESVHMQLRRTWGST